MAGDYDRAFRNVLEKLELLTGERSGGNRRAVLVSELDKAIEDLSSQYAVVKKSVRTLEAQFNQSIASINEELLVRVDENSALAQITTELKSSLENATAQIQDTKRTLATREMALAQHISVLSASLNSNSAAIYEETTVRVTEDEALATSITTLTATVADNTAAITAEATARATADDALASSITTLTATVAGHTAEITTLTTSVADISGFLSAEWYVKVTLDGAPAGGIRLLGIKNQDGSISKDLYIDANTHIYGNLIVDGTIEVGAGGSPIAAGAISESSVGFGNGSASVTVSSIRADDVFLVVASYSGGDGGAVFGVNGSLQIKQDGVNIGVAAPISGFVVSGYIASSVMPAPLIASYATAGVSTTAKATAGSVGNITFSCTTGLSAPTSIYVVRLSR